MKLSQGLQNFWTMVGTYLLMAIAGSLFVVWGFGHSMASLIGIIVILAIVGFAFSRSLADLKSKMVRHLPETFEYRAASFADFPTLDFSWMRQTIQELKTLVFEELMDYTTGAYPGLGCCLTHPQALCFAEVTHLFRTTGETIAANVVIYSVMEQDWALCHISRAPLSLDSISYMWRNSHAVRVYQATNDLNMLLQSHLTFRQRMMADLNLGLKSDLSWDSVCDREQKAATFRRRIMQQKPLLLALIEATLYELNPRSVWWGDYAPKSSYSQ